MSIKAGITKNIKQLEPILADKNKELTSQELKHLRSNSAALVKACKIYFKI